MTAYIVSDDNSVALSTVGRLLLQGALKRVTIDEGSEPLYRDLKPGEIMQPGDQVLSKREAIAPLWLESLDAKNYHPVPNNGILYRRPVYRTAAPEGTKIEGSENPTQVLWKASGSYVNGCSSVSTKNGILVQYGGEECLIPYPKEPARDEAEKAWKKSNVRASVKVLNPDIFEKVKADWIKDHIEAAKGES